MRTQPGRCNVRWTRGPPESTVTVSHDWRHGALLAWANEVLGCEPAWTTASADASSRRYFRGVAGTSSWIAMDAPPQREKNDAFVQVATLLAQAGVHAPSILHRDMQRGFFLLTDLGRDTYLDALAPGNADRLFDAAIQTLITWQCSSRANVLPVFARAEFARELALFREWFLPCYRQHVPTAAQSRALDTAFEFLLDNAMQQPQVFVHRDYMPRNLMLSQPLPGVLDFQDARYGPVTYDVASLFKDAFISWPQARVQAWLQDYWRQARAAGVPVAADFATFSRQAELMAAQRHLKILGLFVRIARRDGKARYLNDIPRFIAYLEPVVARYPQLAGLAPFLVAEASA